MPIFIDLMYPDNANRKRRLDELANDCQLYMNETADKKNQITQIVAKTNDIIKKAYQSVAKDPPALTKIEVVKDSILAIPETIAGIISIPIAASMMKWAFSTYLLRTGRITAEELATLGASKLIKINIGKFFRIGGGVGSALLITLALESIIDSVEGAVQRSQLQNAIRDIVPQRTGIKKAYCINDLIYQTCSAVVIAYDTYVQVGGLPPETLDALATSMVKNHEVKIESVTDAVVNAMLGTLDTGRESWTKEDRASNVLQMAMPRMGNALPSVLQADAKKIAFDAFVKLDCLDAEQKQRVDMAFKRS